jgi:hypothetical protein
VLRKIFGPKREKITEENTTLRSFIICILHQIFLGLSNQSGWDGQGIRHAQGDEKCT